jgi:transglutaminase-like putative cysteine protease
MAAHKKSSSLILTVLPALSARYWQPVALLAAVFPQMDRLPLWLTVLVVVSGIWRLPAIERRLGTPGFFLRTVLLLAGMAGVFYSHHSFLGPEGGVSFLILCAVMKVLESQQKRDFFVSAILNFFILATAFLFSQSLLLTVYVALACIVILSAMLALQQREDAGFKLTVRRASVLLLQAFPLMLVLFVFFPRLPPLWTLNFSQGSGRTGMSDSMSPGDIAHLSESADVAFRVEFQGPPPPSRQLYWRGLVFTHFDGQRWSQGETINASALKVTEQHTDIPVKYRVLLEPTDQSWLYALAVPSSTTANVLLTRDYRLVYRKPVFERLSYDVQSLLEARVDVDALPAWEQSQNLRLPAEGNPETRLMAKRWREGSGSAEKYVSDTLDWFRQEHFFYTLEPPPLGENRIDDFLFHTRRGFCEHYASSFVFLMRAAGIPARVVAGYQGGEQSPLANYWVVRQLDAHAWAEVWLPQQGWVSVDPTAAVAPDRIQRGAPQLASQRAYWGSSDSSAVRYNSYRLLKSLRNFSDYVNYRWHRDVLGYNTEQQENFMMRVLGDSSLLRRIAVMGLAFLAVGVLLFLWALRGQRRELHPLDRIYRRYCDRLAKQGVLREAGEGPQAFARRIAHEKPELAAEAEEFSRLYMALRYRPRNATVGMLEQRLRRLARGRVRG